MLSENFFWHSGLPLSVIDGNTSIANYGPANTVANVAYFEWPNGLRQWQQSVR